MKLVRILFISILFVLLFSTAPLPAQDMPKDYQEVLTILGRSGDYKASVLKVNVPRNDLHVTISGVATPTPFAALHNHFFWEEPRIFFMHVHGHGNALDLAKRLKPALDLIPRPPAAAPSTTPAAGPAFNLAALDTIVGSKGEALGSVYKFTLGRDDLTLKEHGASINARMGLNTWAAFAGSDADAQIAGDVAMRETEVTPVLKALRAHKLNVVAIHNHMLGTQPTVIFLHYWGRGPAAELALGFRAALDVLGK